MLSIVPLFGVQDRFGSADAWLAAQPTEVVERQWQRVRAYMHDGVPRALLQHLRLALDDFTCSTTLRLEA